MALRLDRLQRGQKIQGPEGVTIDFQNLWQNAMKQIEEAFLSLEEQVAAIAAAQAAADAANAAAAVATAAATTANNAAAASSAETSIVSSFVKDFAGNSPLEADTSGNVTIKAHTRQYGDTTLNPDVVIPAPVVLATGEAPTSIVRVYYDDATRADTTPPYAYTVDPASGPVQGGDRHVVGAIEIPGAGTSEGGYVRSPGYTNPIP